MLIEQNRSLAIMKQQQPNLSILFKSLEIDQSLKQDHLQEFQKDQRLKQLQDTTVLLKIILAIL